MRGREDARHIGEHVKIFPLPGRYLAFSKAEPAPRNQRGEKLPIGYEPVMKVRPFHSMSANPPRPLRNPYMRRPPYAYAIFIRHRTFPIRHNARKASWRPAVAAPPGPCQPPLFRLKVSEETLNLPAPATQKGTILPPTNQPKDSMSNLSQQHPIPTAPGQQDPGGCRAIQAIAPSLSSDRNNKTTSNNPHCHPQHAANLTRRRFMGGALALVAAALGSMATGCSAPITQAFETLEASDPEKPRYVSPYNWEGLVRTDGRWDYLEDGQLRSRWGIDVSEHQKTVNWEQVATAGVDFAFVRIGNRGASQGQLRVDDYFLENAIGASKAGIQTESYFFSQALTEVEAEEEAALAIRQAQEANAQGASIAVIAFDHEPVEVEGPARTP